MDGWVNGTMDKWMGECRSAWIKDGSIDKLTL